MPKVLDDREVYFCYLKFFKLYNNITDNCYQQIKIKIYYELKDSKKNYIGTKEKEIIIYEGYDLKDTEYITDSLSLILLPEIISDKMEIVDENLFDSSEGNN